VVLKISGAALACTGPNNIDPKVINLIAREVAMACRLGVEVTLSSRLLAFYPFSVKWYS
jgi:uridylate kinase